MTKNQNSQENLTILVLGTGGTIAGLSANAKNGQEANQDVAYTSAVLPVDSLIPASKHRIITEQIAQIDSKDMSFEVWERLYERIMAAQNDAGIDAIVVTHGTDTMEETAYFLHRTVQATKPVILTGAMRPADSKDSDGPQNLADALKAASSMACARAALADAGVWVAFAGRIFSGGNVQKVHPTRLDAFDVIQSIPTSDAPEVLSRLALQLPVKRWPCVEIVMSYAGASSALVDALTLQKIDGIVLAGTGNATLHHALEASLNKAREAGIAVSLSTRCLQSGAMLSPLQVRIELILQLMQTNEIAV